MGLPSSAPPMSSTSCQSSGSLTWTNFSQAFLRCPASQVVALQAERVDLGPGQLGFRLRQGLQRASVEERGAPGHELVAARAGADEVDGRADELTDPLDVVAAVRGQIVPAFRRCDPRLPAWKC